MNKKILLLFLICLSACDKNKVYEKHQDVKNYLMWSKNDLKKFTVTIEDTISNCNIFIALRHHSHINYKDLSVGVSIIKPDDSQQKEDFNIPLRDSKTDKLLGEASYEICDLETLVFKNFNFNQIGDYTFEIYPNEGEEEIIVGIIQVGILIKQIGKE